jgi:hypothetical protein
MSDKPNLPPLEKRMSILNEYIKARQLMGFQAASEAYKKSMDSLYLKHNPYTGWQKPRSRYSKNY